MEDRKISQAESLAIITEMIDRTKSHSHLCNGSILLLWGYLSVAVALAVAILLWLTNGHPAANWLWFLIWIVGGTFSPVLARRHRVRAIPAVGALLKEEDRGEVQMDLLEE